MSGVRLDDDDTIPTDGDAALAELVASLHLVVADWGVSSDIGRVRGENQDAWGESGNVFVVADGMGGHAGGSLAATTAVAAFLDHAEQPWTRLLHTVNDRVRAAAAAGDTPGAGTTLVAARIRDRGALVVSIGDSRVYRWRRGDLDVVTADHTLASDMMAVGVDADDQRRRGIRVGGLTSYLGVAPHRVRGDVTEIPLGHGDRLALVTDGVHNAVDAGTIAGALGASTAEQAAHSLVNAAMAAGGRDNATAVVVEVELVEREQGAHG